MHSPILHAVVFSAATLWAALPAIRFLQQETAPTVTCLIMSDAVMQQPDPCKGTCRIAAASFCAGVVSFYKRPCQGAARHKAACAATLCMRCKKTGRVCTCKPALDLQVLQLDMCTSLHGEPAAAAILAIAQHSKLGELALPPLCEQQSVVLDLLRNSKDLRHLSASQLTYAIAFHKGSSCRGCFAISLQRALACCRPHLSFFCYVALC